MRAIMFCLNTSEVRTMKKKCLQQKLRISGDSPFTWKIVAQKSSCFWQDGSGEIDREEMMDIFEKLCK
jgi:hypothetical protein